jgi:hypothetical protein
MKLLQWVIGSRLYEATYDRYLLLLHLLLLLLFLLLLLLLLLLLPLLPLLLLPFALQLGSVLDRPFLIAVS